MRRNRLWSLLLFGSTAVLILFILTDWLTTLRGPAPETAEWYWPHLIRPYTHWLKPLLATLLMGGVSVWWLWLEEHGRMVKAGLWLLAGASLLLQLALMNADSLSVRDELINRVYSNLESGFFQPAAELPNLGSSLTNYPALMPTFSSEHARTHPPGLLIANRLTMDLLARFPALAERLAYPAAATRCIDLWLLDRPTAVSAALLIWAIIPLLAAALTVFPAYWLAKELLGSTAVRLATLLVITLPSLLLFAPKAVQLYAPLSLLIFLTFYRGLQNWSWRWFFLSGLLFSLATFLSLGNLSLALLLGAYVSGAYVSGAKCQAPSHPLTPPPVHLFTCSLAFALGAATLWLIYWLGWGVPPWVIFQTGLGQHYELVTHIRRYEWWLAWNLVDVLVFAGWVVVVGFTAVLLQTIRRRPLTPVHWLAISTAVLLLVLDISGAARGEVGRLWLFFFPFLALAAADWLAETQPGWRQQAALVGLQLALTLALALAWQPVRAVAVVAQRPSIPAATPENNADILFGDALRLTGYTVRQNETALEVTLFWRGERGVLRPYTVFNHLLNAQGELVAQQDNWPVNGQWPPTCWQNGETVVDQYAISLPDDLPPGVYTLMTGWYDAADGRRLLTATGQDAIVVHQYTWE
ncbi:MAG: hypothetical protein HND44_10765 [Chloroflexi bacterium]|nr:hypothetical protein [Ardenticatenaceae bacterium]MBL1128958.1 hypothetical protein [Chloroflexota bacterium]NOG35038.1 hypothetical protein [Chloroflexota bacterium]GIK58148.1 MAG: hypothetical protein BroJett015_38110 [Chloroflexota bacterium]